MHSSRGFSFVEVMMVISIIGIMVGVAFVSLSWRRNGEILKTAAREVVASIRMAQNNALTGDRRGVPSGYKGLCWVEFSQSPGVNTSYRIFTRSVQNSGDDCLSSSGSDGMVETFPLSSGISFGALDWNSSGKVIRFGIPRANVAPSDSSTICLGRNNQSITVSVSEVGVVTELEVYNGTCPE